MCFVLISKQIATFTLCSINRLILYHRCGDCSLSARTESLYKIDTFVYKGECRHNDMIVMYTVMLALPVTLCSSSVCGTVFKFIHRPCYIHLVGSVAVNGHQVLEIFPCLRSVCVWSDFKTFFSPVSSFSLCLKWFQNFFSPLQLLSVSFVEPLSDTCF